MKRGRLFDISDCCVHVTHRCHNRQFLLKFACDRRNYVSRLRATSLHYDVEFLDYAITSNHVHLLLWAPSLDAVSEAMQFLRVASSDCRGRSRELRPECVLQAAGRLATVACVGLGDEWDSKKPANPIDCQKHSRRSCISYSRRSAIPYPTPDPSGCDSPPALSPAAMRPENGATNFTEPRAQTTEFGLTLSSAFSQMSSVKVTKCRTIPRRLTQSSRWVP
jgi:REP element-mobilizing transposase RayT